MVGSTFSSSSWLGRQLVLITHFHFSAGRPICKILTSQNLCSEELVQFVNIQISEIPWHARLYYYPIVIGVCTIFRLEFTQQAALEQGYLWQSH